MVARTERRRLGYHAPATVSGTDDVTYTYTFAKSTTPIVPGNVLYVVEHYKANDDGTYPVSATETSASPGRSGQR